MEQDLTELRLTDDECYKYDIVPANDYGKLVITALLDAQIRKARAPLLAQLEAKDQRIAELETSVALQAEMIQVLCDGEKYQDYKAENKALREALKECYNAVSEYASSDDFGWGGNWWEEVLKLEPEQYYLSEEIMNILRIVAKARALLESHDGA